MIYCSVLEMHCVVGAARLPDLSNYGTADGSSQHDVEFWSNGYEPFLSGFDKILSSKAILAVRLVKYSHRCASQRNHAPPGALTERNTKDRL
jgi:hypothetical protein